jgi:exopolyphosphatase / guanosine-5'-triphosphate,3'-diphosphate pyrophosphatase
MRQPRAAVDVGTNSVRLLLVDAAGQRITREMTITRLGSGVDRNGHLDDQALARTLDTIAAYRLMWTEHGVDPAHVRVAATSAVRDAADRDRFFDGVRQVADVTAEVITGVEEAALSFSGAVRAVEVATPTAVVDIGGGSTELIVGDAEGEVAGSVSLQLGCVRLTERCLSSDPPTTEQLAAARHLVRDGLDEADRCLGAAGTSLGSAAALIGVAGTVTTLAALHLGLPAYQEERIHGARIPASAVRDLAVELCSMTSAQRAALGPVQPGREDVLHGGALVLAAVVERYGFADVVVSESDILDGMVAALR